MKIKIARSDLAVLVSRGGGSAAKNAAVPILAHARLTASEGALRVSSCDTYCQADAIGSAAVEVEGDVTVSAAALKTIVDRLPAGGEVSLAADGNDLVVKCGRSRVRLPTLPVDQFPSLDSVPMKGAASFTLSGADLDRLLARAIPIGALGAAMTSLNSVYLHTSTSDDGIRAALGAVATNGHILLLARVDMPEGADKLPSGGVMLPVDAATNVLKLFRGEAEVRIAISANRATFSGGTTGFTTKLVEGTYPDFRRVIPAAGSARIVVNRDSANSTLSLLDPFASGEQGRKIECAPWDGGLAVAAAAAGEGDSFGVIDAETEGDVPVFGLSLSYLRTMLGAFRGDVIRLSLSDATAPILATADGDDTVGVLMPMRVAGRIVREAPDVAA